MINTAWLTTLLTLQQACHVNEIKYLAKP